MSKFNESKKLPVEVYLIGGIMLLILCLLITFYMGANFLKHESCLIGLDANSMSSLEILNFRAYALKSLLLGMVFLSVSVSLITTYFHKKKLKVS